MEKTNTTDLNLVLAARLHVPVFGSHEDFEIYTEQVCLPVLRALKEHGAVSMNLSISGPLIGWLDKNCAEASSIISELLSGGRLELMGGGYYSPVFPSVPERDVLGQMNRLTDRIVQRFDFVVRGVELPGNVWGARVPSSIGKAGLEYALVDAGSLRSAGVSDKNICGWRVTENNSYVCRVFAGDQSARDVLLAEKIDEDALRELATDCNGHCVVVSADARAFASGTDSITSGQALSVLFSFLSDNEHWIKTRSFCDALSLESSSGSVHMNNCVPEALAAFVMPEGADNASACTWAGALDKYPELNRLHKKMLYVSQKVWNFAGAEVNALDSLWKAQSCDVFLPVPGTDAVNPEFIKQAYSSLISAEVAADAVRQKRRDWLECEVVDFDCDGRDEVLLNSSQVSLYFSKSRGGRLFEYDSRSFSVNFCATGSQDGMFIDRLLDSGKGLDCVELSGNNAAVCDFSNAVFEHSIIRRDEQSFVRFVCEGSWKADSGKEDIIWLEKIFSITAYRKVVAEYTLRWSSDTVPEGAVLAVEFNPVLCLDAKDSFAQTDAGRVEIFPGQDASLEKVDRIAFGAGENAPGMDVKSSCAMDVVFCPEPKSAGRMFWKLPVVKNDAKQVSFRMVCDMTLPAAKKQETQGADSKKSVSENE